MGLTQPSTGRVSQRAGSLATDTCGDAFEVRSRRPVRRPCSTAIASPALLIASATAFLLSELMDMAVSAPLHCRGLSLAVFVLSVVGLFVDTLVFPQLAFGSVDLMWRQGAGKGLVVLLASPLVYMLGVRIAGPAILKGIRA